MDIINIVTKQHNQIEQNEKLVFIIIISYLCHRQTGFVDTFN